MTGPTPLSRKTVRTALAAIFTFELVGPGKPLTAVYANQVATFESKGPTLVIASMGTGPDTDDSGLGSIIIDLFFEIHVFVPYSDEGFTESESEDLLDDLDVYVRKILLQYGNVDTAPSDVPWLQMWREDRSQVRVFADLAGEEYRHEITLIGVRAANTE
jgi:hypothetical protein